MDPSAAFCLGNLLADILMFVGIITLTEAMGFWGFGEIGRAHV
jgi:hypothetical protein